MQGYNLKAPNFVSPSLRSIWKNLLTFAHELPLGGDGGHLVKYYQIFPLTWAKEVGRVMSVFTWRMSDFYSKRSADTLCRGLSGNTVVISGSFFSDDWFSWHEWHNSVFVLISLETPCHHTDIRARSRHFVGPGVRYGCVPVFRLSCQ